MAGLELSTRVHQVIIVAKQQEEASQEVSSLTWMKCADLQPCLV